MFFSVTTYVFLLFLAIKMTDVLTHLTAGTIAGMTGVLVDYPLDTMKTRMQVRCQNSPSSYVECAARLYQQGGITAFYRGLSVPFAAQGAEAAIIFTVYNTALRHFRAGEGLGLSDDATRPSIWSSTSYWKAAACAGLAVSLVLTPVEMLKCNLQMESSRPSWQRRHVTVRSLAHELHQDHGIRGFYRGMTGTMTRAVLGNIAYFLSYEQCKQWLTPATTPAASSAQQHPQHQDKQHRQRHPHPHSHASTLKETKEPKDAAVPAWRSMLAGGISGCLYWTIAYPADVVKTQMQVCSQAGAAGFTHTFQRCYQTGGVRALYRGWAVTAVRAFVSSAVVFTTYERCARVIAEVGPVHVSLMRETAATE